MGGTIGILGVDTEKEYRDLYSGWLGADYDVTTVADGESALEELDSTIDLVLLAAELDNRAGSQLAEAIDDTQYDTHVVLAGSEPASFDIVDYPIESYVEKPLDGPDLDRIVEQFETQQSYQAALEEYFRLTSKLGSLEAEYSEKELATSDRYHRLQKRVEEKRAEVDEAISTNKTDWDFAFKSCAKPNTSDVVQL